MPLNIKYTTRNHCQHLLVQLITVSDLWVALFGPKLWAVWWGLLQAIIESWRTVARVAMARQTIDSTASLYHGSGLHLVRAAWAYTLATSLEMSLHKWSTGETLCLPWQLRQCPVVMSHIGPKVGSTLWIACHNRLHSPSSTMSFGGIKKIWVSRLLPVDCKWIATNNLVTIYCNNDFQHILFHTGEMQLVWFMCWSLWDWRNAAARLCEVCMLRLLSAV